MSEEKQQDKQEPMMTQGASADEMTAEQAEEQLTAEQQPAASSTERSSNLFPIIASLLILLLIAACYFLWMEQYKLTKQLRAIDQQSMQHQIDQLEKQLQQQGIAVTEKLSAQQQREQMFEQSLQNLHQRIQHRADHDVRLIEVQSLLSLASNQYELSQDIETALLAMRQADKLFMEFTDPAIINIRDALKTEMTSLAGLTLPPVDSVLADIRHLLTRVDILPLLSATPQAVEPDTSSEQTAPQPAANWRNSFKQMFKELQPLLTIRRKEHATPPMLSHEGERLVRLVLKSRYEILRQAVMLGNAEIVSRSLADIDHWLQRYFDKTHADMQSTLSALERIGSINFDLTYPQLGKSLTMLKQYRQQQNQGPEQ